MSQLSDIINQINSLTGYSVSTGSGYVLSQSATPIGSGSVNTIINYINSLTGYEVPITDIQYVSGSNVAGPLIIYTPFAAGGTISTAGILPGQIIKAEQVLRVINALNGVNINDIIISGSLATSGSNIFDGSLSLPFIPNNKLLYTSGGYVTSIDYPTGSQSTVSASYASTASYAIGYLLVDQTGSMLQPYLLIDQTGSMTVLSSSYAITASYAANSISASYAVTAAYAQNAGAAVNTGSLLTTASVLLNTITFTKGDGSTFPITVNTGSGGGTVSGDYVTTSSFNSFTSSVVTTSSFNSYTSSAVTTSSFNAFTSSVVTTSSFNNFTQSYNTGSFTGSFTGSLQGTASYATTASYALNGGGSGLSGGTDTYIPLWSGSNALTSSFLQQTNNIIQTVYEGNTNSGILLNLSQSVYNLGAWNTGNFTNIVVSDKDKQIAIDALDLIIIGDNSNSQNSTQLIINDTSQSIKTTTGTGDKGLSLDFANLQYSLGDYNNINNGTRITIEDDDGANQIRAISSGSSTFIAQVFGSTRGGVYLGNSQYFTTNEAGLYDVGGDAPLAVCVVEPDNGLTYRYSPSIKVDNTSGLTTIYNGLSITGSVAISGSLNASNITSSLFGTASYANNSTSSSYASSSTSASYATTASYAMNAGTTIDTGSFVTTSSFNTFTSSFNTFTSSYNTGSFSGSFTGSLQGTASWAHSSSVAISSSYAINGGVTQILQGSNITVSGNGTGQVTISSTGGGSSYNTATGSYGSFYSTVTQTNVASTARSMSLNVTDISNGVSISGSIDPFNTYIKTENAGIYNIQFSAQVDKTDSGTDEIWVWLRKNGSNIDDSATSIQLVGNGAHYVAAWNFFVNSSANDYYQLMWYSPDANVRLHAEAGFGVVPGIPSLIVTVNRVDQFLSNTGSFSGSFTGVFTGSLQGTATTASYVTASNVVGSVTTADTASHAVNFTIDQTLTLNQTLTRRFNVDSTSVGSNSFDQATGSFTSAHGKYTIYKGTNARAGEFVTAWNGTTTTYYDNATTDIGNTSDITFTSVIASGDVKINAVAASSGWTVKMVVTYL